MTRWPRRRWPPGHRHAPLVRVGSVPWTTRRHHDNRRPFDQGLAVPRRVTRRRRTAAAGPRRRARPPAGRAPPPRVRHVRPADERGGEAEAPAVRLPEISVTGPARLPEALPRSWVPNSVDIVPGVEIGRT